MAIVIWKDKVKVVVGEISRKSELQLANAMSRDVDGLGADATVGDFSEWLDEMLGSYATRAVQVFEDGTWRALQDGETVMVESSEGDTFPLTYPLTSAAFKDLPGSLYEDWLNAVGAENQRVQNRFLSFITSQIVTQNTSGPPSAAAQ